MQMLGQTVAKLRAANGWSLQELAARVQLQGAKNVKYQHIQQLESKPNTSPRYILELASAFEKTVEELRQWQEGMPTLGPNGSGPRWSVAEDRAPAFSRKPSPQEAEELALIEDFRACAPDVQKALRTIIAASRSKASHRPG